MILYSLASSPYSAAVRVALYAKALDIEVVDPPGGLGSTRFHSINALGTIPCLVHDDLVLPESVAILEYLDEVFPTPPLLPKEPRARASVRVVQRIAELGILNPAVELKLLRDIGANKGRSASASLTRLVRGIASADAYVSEGQFAIGESLTLADCQLSIALSRVQSLIHGNGIPDLLTARPRLAHYLKAIAGNPYVSRVLTEMDDHASG